MIHYIKGKLVEKGNDHLVLDHQGMGYQIYTSSVVLNELSNFKDELKIYTYMYIREDILALYGFLKKEDLDIFKLLLTVNGIGPKAALGVLSVLTTSALKMAVFSGDVKAISKAPGIGAKTAQKLIIELKDKLDLEDFLNPKDVPEETNDFLDQAKNEASMALLALGYSESEVFHVLHQISFTADMDSEAILKLALKQMLTI